MRDNAPKTVMSPMRPTHARRGPMFYVALLGLGIFSIAAGAIVVLLFVVDRAAKTLPSSALPVSDAGVTVTVVPPAAIDATASVTVATTPASFDPKTPSKPIVNKPPTVTSGCLCLPKSGVTNSLCAKEKLGPSSCSCESVPGSTTLCPVPWKQPDGCPTKDQFGGSMTAKDGDPCTGYESSMLPDAGYTNGKLAGKLAGCTPCSDVETYTGKIGSACVGYRSERTPIDGVVSCSNLEFDCKRGNGTACTELKLH